MPTEKSTANKKRGSRVYATRKPDGTFAKISETSSRAGTQREKTKRDAEPGNSPSEPLVPAAADPSKQAILALAGKYRDTSWWDEYEAAIEEVRDEQCTRVTEG